MNWTVHHLPETSSTNLDARGAAPWTAFTADFQTAGRGRLDHRWHSASGVNLMMSAVVPVDGMPPEAAATFPLVAGLAVVGALSSLCPDASAPFLLKWPNDVYVGGRKVCGILCERDGERIIAGIGVNVGERSFPAEIAARATSLALAVNAAGRLRGAAAAHRRGRLPARPRSRSGADRCRHRAGRRRLRRGQSRRLARRGRPSRLRRRGEDFDS